MSYPVTECEARMRAYLDQFAEEMSPEPPDGIELIEQSEMTATAVCIECGLIARMSGVYWHDLAVVRPEDWVVRQQISHEPTAPCGDSGGES